MTSAQSCSDCCATEWDNVKGILSASFRTQNIYSAPTTFWNTDLVCADKFTLTQWANRLFQVPGYSNKGLVFCKFNPMNRKMGYVMKCDLFLQWQESYEQSLKVLRCFQFIHKASKEHARKLEKYKLKSPGSTGSVATEWLEFNIDSILKYLFSSFPRIHSLRRIMCYCKHALSSTCTS